MANVLQRSKAKVERAVYCLRILPGDQLGNILAALENACVPPHAKVTGILPGGGGHPCEIELVSEQPVAE